MKVTLNQIEKGEDEVIINYLEMTEEVEDIVRVASGGDEKIPCSRDSIKCMVAVRDILYIESVDRETFAYTSNDVYKIPLPLNNIEAAYAHRGFFRCSKSMIINIYRVSELRSEAAGRIDAKMENGEHVIISRKYAKALRCELRGGE
ncbi:MAG: LytTR family DNA-binding domain-containing protein [Firmicutes bacterium]|nr:LytTR family DNA-binding domain-containing protein [Bacillota bacterium]